MDYQTARLNFYHDQFQTFIKSGINIPSMCRQVSSQIRGWHHEYGRGVVFCDLTKMFHAWMQGKITSDNSIYPVSMGYAPMTKYKQWLPEYDWQVGAKQLMYLVATYEPEQFYILLLSGHITEDVAASPRSLAFQTISIE